MTPQPESTAQPEAAPVPDAQPAPPAPLFKVSSKDLAALKAEAHDVDVSLHVGKDGVTDSLGAELARQLERQRLVKVRLLKSAQVEGDRKSVATDLAGRGGAFLVEVRGNTAVYYKPRSRARRPGRRS